MLSERQLALPGLEALHLGQRELSDQLPRVKPGAPCRGVGEDQSDDAAALGQVAWWPGGIENLALGSFSWLSPAVLATF